MLFDWVYIDRIFVESFTYLTQQSEMGLFYLFWFSFLFEVPRFVIAFIIFILFGRIIYRPATPDYFSYEDENEDSLAQIYQKKGATTAKVSVIIVGHNEGQKIERCARSLREQTLNDFEIIIASDGSTDNMSGIAQKLVKKGVADRAISTSTRGGKSAAINMAKRFAKGEFIVVVDSDGSFNRFALEQILQPFKDPDVGIVSGNVLVRNGKKSFIAATQAVEYLICVSLGREILQLINSVSCSSGAFSAFRKTTLDDVYGVDVGGGEDFDLTLRVRQKGWKVAFVPEAICYTDVPHNLWGYIRQRLRWERDSMRLRYRKHGAVMNPFSHRFKAKELFHQYDFLFFNIIAGLAMPIYLVWLFTTYSAPIAILAVLSTMIVLIIVNMFGFMLAVIRSGRHEYWRYILFVPAYSISTDFLMRFVRLYAYGEEFFRNASAKDNFVPKRVRSIRKW